MMNNRAMGSSFRRVLQKPKPNTTKEMIDRRIEAVKAQIDMYKAKSFKLRLEIVSMMRTMGDDDIEQAMNMKFL